MSPDSHDSSEGTEQEETKEELIERLLAKAELDFKCCGSHFDCEGGG